MSRKVTVLIVKEAKPASALHATRFQLRTGMVDRLTLQSLRQAHGGDVESCKYYKI